MASGLPDGVLDKVRALLAKAESSDFEAEAEAFTAKAQELMTRYRIERVLVEEDEAHGRRASSRQIRVPEPYATPKALLLAKIAAANGCSAVWSKAAGLTTVFGGSVELDAVDTLYTSLLVQATAALQRHGAKVDAFGRSRTKSFRRSFLLSFATRIGVRLEEAVASTVRDAEAEISLELVPILADRARAARAAAEEAFPETRTFAASASDGEGWYTGRAFADQVDLAPSAQLCA